MEGSSEDLDPGCRQGPAWGRSRPPLPASHRVKRVCWSETLPAPGFLQAQRAQRRSSRKSPSLAPNLAPVSPGVHWLPARCPELSLGRAGWGLSGTASQLALVRSEGQERLLPLLGGSADRVGLPVLVFGVLCGGRALSCCPWPYS